MRRRNFNFVGSHPLTSALGGASTHNDGNDMTADTGLALEELIAQNERTIGAFYRLAASLLVAGLIAHLAFASYYVYSATAVGDAHVWLFGVFNIAALIVEVYLSRIAFMLGSRVGQLRDMRYALRITESNIDTARLELAARAIMSMRRDVSTLKIMDVESIVTKLPGDKSGGKDTP